MKTFWLTVKIAALAVVLAALETGVVYTQPPPAPEPVPTPPPSPLAPAGDPAQGPAGVEVLARGPVHEAFATPTTEPVPTPPIDRQPPKPINEIPPADKPASDAVWIPGYWAWDDERRDFLWVSGTWRTPSPGMNWVAGYWKEEGTQSRWVPGFWAAAGNQAAAGREVTYMPAPPAPPNVAPPGAAPTPDSFYVPGHWVWQTSAYGWSPGYWARVRPDYVWVPAHYRWTPGGYVFIPGYWDLAIARRGFLYAPVYVNAAVVGPAFVYTPAYAVPHTVVIDAFWVRPSYHHYYFGDYYGPVYSRYGFETVVVYGRRHYDPIFTYAVYEHRAEPRWATLQVDLYMGRAAGRYPVPPRTVVEQVRVGYAGPRVVVATRIGEVSGVRTVRLEQRERVEAAHHAAEVRHIAAERQLHEARAHAPPVAPRPANFRAPAAHAPAALHTPTAAPSPKATPSHAVPLRRPLPPPRKDKDKEKHSDRKQ